MTRRRRRVLSDLVRYPYLDPEDVRRVLFWKVRAQSSDRRGKTFWYLTPDPACPTPYSWNAEGTTVGLPKGNEVALLAVNWLYRALYRQDEFVLWTEGEKDAVNAIRAGLAQATSHHGAAGGATPEQADHFLAYGGYRGTVLVVADRDDPGYYCAFKRRQLLWERGVAARVVRPANGVVPLGLCPPGECRHDDAELCPPDNKLWRGVDLSDHLAAGYGLADLVPVAESDLRTAADRWAARQQQGAVYGGFSHPLLTPEFTAELHKLASQWTGWSS